MMDEIDGLSSCQQKRRPFSLYVLLFPPSFFFSQQQKLYTAQPPDFRWLPLAGMSPKTLPDCASTP